MIPAEEFARRGKNAWWRYLLAPVVSMAIAMGVGVIVVAGLMLARRLPPDFAASVLDTANPIRFFITTGCIFGLVLLGFVGGLRLVHGKRFQDIIGNWSWRTFGLAMGLWTAVLLAAALVDFAIAPHGFRLTIGLGLPPLLGAALLGLGVQTFAEEFVFRGYVTQGLLLAVKRPAAAAVMSGLLFGAIHIPNGGPQAVSATIFGVGLALIAIRTGSLAATSGLHLANNLFGAVVLVSQEDAFKGSPGIFSQDTPQLMWLDVAVGACGIALAVAAVTLRPRWLQPA
jgi:membrane protease YdiL (CAAX protease family)